MMKKQFDFPENQLPREIYEGSGAVIANLKRARDIGKQVLMKETKRLAEALKEEDLHESEATKMAQAPGPALLCAALLSSGSRPEPTVELGERITTPEQCAEPLAESGRRPQHDLVPAPG